MFTVKVTGPPGLIKVEFYLDDILQKNDTTNPFIWQFNTDEHQSGEHVFRIAGYSNDDSGEKEFTENFITTTDPVFLTLLLGSIGFVIVFLVMAIVVGRKLTPLGVILKKIRSSDDQIKGKKEIWGNEEN